MGEPRRSVQLHRVLSHDVSGRKSIARTTGDLTKQLSDASVESLRSPRRREGRTHSSTSLGRAERAGDNPFVEYEDREQRLREERRWLQEDRSYLDTRVKELRHRTAQKRKDALMMQKVAGVAGALEPDMRRTAGTLSLPELPRGKGAQSFAALPAPSGARTGRKQTAAVRSLKDLQRELKESILHVDKKQTSKAIGDKAMVLPLLSLGLH
mmetsp:Transcript_96539/g.272971  ORF Transcript_96539/g.272971 Transcript_96539/m.272971 type:complete len:211 (-) Transcript_96539:566-1198(-)